LTNLDIKEGVQWHIVTECLLDVCCQLLLVLQLDSAPLLLEGSVLSIWLQLRQLISVGDPAVRGRKISGRQANEVQARWQQAVTQAKSILECRGKHLELLNCCGRSSALKSAHQTSKGGPPSPGGC
jgi:hypothetical protein